MKYALVEGERICEFAATQAECFPVHASLKWVAVADDTTTQDTYVNGAVVKYVPAIVLDLIAPADFIARFTNQEYLALEKKRRDDIASNNIGIAKNWDICIADATTNVNKQKMQNLKADLVTGGVLTQARADEIFS
jgi:hypothetical protein